METRQITQYTLWMVSFTTGEFSNDNYFFEYKKDAEMAAKAKIGWCNSGGTVSKKTVDNLPKYYNSFIDWARQYLTMNQYDEIIKQ